MSYEPDAAKPIVFSVALKVSSDYQRLTVPEHIDSLRSGQIERAATPWPSTILQGCARGVAIAESQTTMLLDRIMDLF